MINKWINCKSSKKYKMKRKFTFFSWYSPQKSKYPLSIHLAKMRSVSSCSHPRKLDFFEATERQQTLFE